MPSGIFSVCNSFFFEVTTTANSNKSNMRKRQIRTIFQVILRVFWFWFQVHLKSQFILNGVCVIWRGWVDLQRLDGTGCLEFDEDRARVSYCHYVNFVHENSFKIRTVMQWKNFHVYWKCSVGHLTHISVGNDCGDDECPISWLADTFSFILFTVNKNNVQWQ